MSKLDDLEQLGRMRADGGITDAEFEHRKRALLGDTIGHSRSPQITASRKLLAIGLISILTIAALISIAQFGSTDAKVASVAPTAQGDLVSHEPPAQANAPHGIFGGAEPGQDYSVARAHLIAFGFSPAKISRGDEYDMCDMVSCPPFPEAVSCSGTGTNECRFAFQASHGRFVIATTVGEGGNPGLDRIAWASEQEASEVRNRIAGRAAMQDAEPTPVSTPTAFTPAEQILIDRWSDLETSCRGDPSAQAESACVKRDVALDRMIAVGICYGKQGQVNAEYDVHRCAENSLR